MSPQQLSRRNILGLSVAAVAAGVMARTGSFVSAQPTSAPTIGSAQRYRVAASDWMMLKRQTPGALTRAQECGLDGVEVDMGPLGKRPDFENKLRDAEFRTKYVAQARDLNIALSSLAMSAFYGQPVADHPSAVKFCNDWIDLMPQVGTTVGFLPVIFNKQDDPAAAVAKVVALMKQVAPQAQKMGVVIGLNTPLDVGGNHKLLDDIGSPAVRIAYNCGEAVDAGRDVYAELKGLGKDRIAQVIPTLSDGVWLENDKRMDLPRLKGVLDELDWSGWLVLQRSRDRAKASDVRYNFSANAKYVKSIFQAA